MQRYPTHIPLKPCEKGILAIGSGIVSLINPRRGDMIATLGEVTAGSSLKCLRDEMLQTPTGRRILKIKPRITSTSIDLSQKFCINSVGAVYTDWLKRMKVSPDTRLPVRYIDDEELAYVLQRYRECHDFYHCLLNQPINLRGETLVKIFEWEALGLPMTGLGSIGGSLGILMRGKSKINLGQIKAAREAGKRAKGKLLSIYWEEEINTCMDAVRLSCGLTANLVSALEAQ